jgi:histidinol-phosphate/aromatic aminotransferase/cobyric acid decarboxylase-like protein
LDANENPYGPPPEVAQALGSLSFPNVYPDSESRALRKQLAKLNGTPMENILVRPATLFSFSAEENTALIGRLLHPDSLGIPILAFQVRLKTNNQGLTQKCFM